MRIYNVYQGYDPRPEDFRACIRVQDDGQIEWQFRAENMEWGNFWWSESAKSDMIRTIKEYPSLAEFGVEEFTICRQDKE